MKVSPDHYVQMATRYIRGVRPPCWCQLLPWESVNKPMKFSSGIMDTWSWIIHDWDRPDSWFKVVLPSGNLDTLFAMKWLCCMVLPYIPSPVKEQLTTQSDNLGVWLIFTSTIASNSTITPGLGTAGVVISSLGVGVTFIISVILFGGFCICGWLMCLIFHISDAKEWLARARRKKQETIG